MADYIHLCDAKHILLYNLKQRVRYSYEGCRRMHAYTFYEDMAAAFLMFLFPSGYMTCV